MTLEEKQILFRVAQWVNCHRKVVKTIRQLAETEKNYLIIIREIDRVEGQLAQARRQGADATLTLMEWLVTLENFDWRCAYCQTRPFQILSHVIPLPHGGTVLENCVPACYRCKNKYRSNKHIQSQIQEYLVKRQNRDDIPEKNKDEINISHTACLYSTKRNPAKEQPFALSCSMETSSL